MAHIEGVQYAEIAFPHQQLTTDHSVDDANVCFDEHQLQQYRQSVEYANIEFTKSSRVSVVTGSPKFESTV